ncbi:MAG: hypothetical protein DRH11_13435 [Deltaproteobacteria bacterium]|nr:MAG: hypothetical protein DRH11_13435 [Deltaproteobacteria bacterium]
MNKGILLIALLLTACAPWAQVGGPYLSSSSHFSIVLPQKWMMLKTSEYLLISKDGPFLQYILVQERHKSKPFEHTRKVLADAMLPQEAAQVIVDELSSDRSLQGFKLIQNGPADINGHHGFRLFFTNRNADGVVFKTMYYGFLEGEWFFAIRYTAVERYYFQKEVKTFEKMLHTFNPPEADERSIPRPLGR